MNSLPQRAKDYHLRTKSKQKTSVFNSIERSEASPRNNAGPISFKTIAAQRDQDQVIKDYHLSKKYLPMVKPCLRLST